MIKNAVLGFDIPVSKLDAAVPPMCQKLDTPRPVILTKHKKEMDTFGYTTFSREDFVETVDFDRFSISRIDEQEQDSSSDEYRAPKK